MSISINGHTFAKLSLLSRLSLSAKRKFFKPSLNLFLVHKVQQCYYDYPLPASNTYSVEVDQYIHSEWALQWMTLTFWKHIHIFLCTHDQKSHHWKVTQTTLWVIGIHSSQDCEVSNRNHFLILYLCVSNHLYIISSSSFLKAFLCLLRDTLIFPLHIVSFSVWDCDFLLVMLVVPICYCLIKPR